MPPISSTKVLEPRGLRWRMLELVINGRSEYVALDGTEIDIELVLLGGSSPSSPPTSKNDIRRGVRTEVS